MAQRVQIRDDLKYKPPYRVKISKPLVRFEWKGAFEGWSRTWVHNNFWRVRSLMQSEEDAMQECALIFARCCHHYAGKVDNPAWMMAIYKRAVFNDWHTFATKDSRLRATMPPEPSVIDHSAGFLSAAIAGASAEVRLVIKAMADAPAEFLGILFGKQDQLLDPAKQSKAEALTNRRMRRLLGISDPAVDIVSELRALLS